MVEDIDANIKSSFIFKNGVRQKEARMQNLLQSQGKMEEDLQDVKSQQFSLFVLASSRIIF